LGITLGVNPSLRVSGVGKSSQRALFTYFSTLSTGLSTPYKSLFNPSDQPRYLLSPYSTPLTPITISFLYKYKRFHDKPSWGLPLSRAPGIPMSRKCGKIAK
jgi:hypothetical protein